MDRKPIAVLVGYQCNGNVVKVVFCAAGFPQDFVQIWGFRNVSTMPYLSVGTTNACYTSPEGIEPIVLLNSLITLF